MIECLLVEGTILNNRARLNQLGYDWNVATVIIELNLVSLYCQIPQSEPVVFRMKKTDTINDV